MTKTAAPSVTPDETPASSFAPRVGIVCDFREEQWPSMDLVADMLVRYLPTQTDSRVAAGRLCPSFRERFGHLSLLPRKFAWNSDRLMNRFVDYPAWIENQRSHYDLFHIVDHSYAHLIHRLEGKPVVTTCHDLDTFRCVLDPERERRPLWFRRMTRRILDGFLHSDHVVAVSETTREELLRHRLFRPEQITYIANAVHPACSPLANAEADAIASQLLTAREPSTVWLLNVGSTLARKRLDILLHVFAAVRGAIPDAKLVRAGGGFTPAQEQLAKERGVEDAIVILPFLERDVLAAIYRRSTLLLQTSDAEGFGLPVIEAMACGCPVIASDLPVLREAGGDAVEYCEVGNIDAWRDTVLRTLALLREPESAGELRQRSLDRASRFSWAENARQTVEVYRHVLAQQGVGKSVSRPGPQPAR